jgi:hypothetical protein
MQINATGIVFLSSHVTEAMALGLVRKFVLIPAAWATEMPLDMLEAVIAHELAHIKRMDLWANFLQRIVETLFFYHPAVWWLSRRLRVERELCSDALAVAATGERLVYAQTLAHIAGELRSDFRPGLAAFLRGEGDMRLLQRIRNVLSPPTSEQRQWPAGFVALGLAICLWTLSLTLFSSLAPSARAAEEPAQEEAASDDGDGDGDGNSDENGEQEEAQEVQHVELDLAEPQVTVELVADVQVPHVEAVLADDARAPQIEAVLVAETQDPQFEWQFTAEPRTVDVSVDTSKLIERAVAEAVKKALAQAEAVRKKEIDKATRKVDLELKKVHEQHARDNAPAARKKAIIEAAEAQKLQQKLQGILLKQQVELKNKANEEVKFAKARQKEQAEAVAMDKALLQQVNDRRFEELTVMVKELSLQVKQLSSELNDLRKETGERRSKDDDGERLF